LALSATGLLLLPWAIALVILLLLTGFCRLVIVLFRLLRHHDSPVWTAAFCLLRFNAADL
jgi:hypothetical protein